MKKHFLLAMIIASSIFYSTESLARYWGSVEAGGELPSKCRVFDFWGNEIGVFNCNMPGVNCGAGQTGNACSVEGIGSGTVFGALTEVQVDKFTDPKGNTYTGEEATNMFNKLLFGVTK